MSLIGKAIAHYKIREKIGAGGSPREIIEPTVFSKQPNIRISKLSDKSKLCYLTG